MPCVQRQSSGFRFRYRAEGEPPRRGNSRHSSEEHASTFRPGDAVRQTGIYEVIHAGEHRSAHEAVMLSGDVFPECETCLSQVRFHLLRTAPYIFQDEDFEDPDA